MKTNAKCGRPAWSPSHKLNILGILLPLFLFPPAALSDDITNSTAVGFSPAAAAGAGGTIAAGTVALPKFTLPATRDLMLTSNVVQTGTGSTHAGDLTIRPETGRTDGTTNLPNPLSILKHEVPMPGLGAKVLVRQAGSDAILRTGASPNASLDWGQVGSLIVRFFEPRFQPAAPGGRSDLIQGERNRPWPVISAGAATGKSWNEPATYQAQGFLSLRW